MSSSTLIVEPVDTERNRVSSIAQTATTTGRIDLNDLPEDLRRMALLALDAYARGERITAVVDGGQPLTTTEAANALGVSRTHLVRMHDEGRIDGFHVGAHLRVPASEVARVLSARASAMSEARAAAATADQRRRDRAAKAAGI